MARHPFAEGLLLLLVALPATVAVGAVPVSAGELPGYVRLHLAGGKIEDEADYVKYDPAERYYLIATGDCDGALLLGLARRRTPDGQAPEAGGAPRRLHLPERASLVHQLQRRQRLRRVAGARRAPTM